VPAWCTDRMKGDHSGRIADNIPAFVEVLDFTSSLQLHEQVSNGRGFDRTNQDRQAGHVGNSLAQLLIVTSSSDHMQQFHCIFR